MPLSRDDFFDALRAHGDRPALRQSGRVLGYRDVLGEVAARARRLSGCGARRLALALDNGIEWALWDLAALSADVVCVPLPAFFSAAQQAHVLDAAGVDALVADRATFREAGFAPAENGLATRSVERPARLPPGTAKITFTSGSTGRPKGVCLDAAAQLAVAASVRDASATSAIDRHLCVLPLATLLENVAGLYAPLLAGAQVELLPVGELGLALAGEFDVGRFHAALLRADANSVILVPQLLLALVAALANGAARPASLRFVAVGGGRVSPALLHAAERVGLPVFEGYGLSECASVVCLNAPGERRIGTVGRPLPHAEVRIGPRGEVLVRGARMLGYLGEPGPSGGWLDTGDLGAVDAGFVVLHGRRKHQFVTAYGRNVNPEWVEAELVREPAIAQAWLYGDALAENVAVLVPRHADVADGALAAAVAAVNRELPDYARAHRWLRASAPFTAANGLATANGRLRRDALLDAYRPTLLRSVEPAIPLSGDLQ